MTVVFHPVSGGGGGGGGGVHLERSGMLFGKFEHGLNPESVHLNILWLLKIVTFHPEPPIAMWDQNLSVIYTH